MKVEVPGTRGDPEMSPAPFTVRRVTLFLGKSGAVIWRSDGLYNEAKGKAVPAHAPTPAATPSR